MEKEFASFMNLVDIDNRNFVNQLNEYLLKEDYKCVIKESKSGFVVSYIKKSKYTLATFVFRKSGIKLRIYPEHIQEYSEFLDTLPSLVKKEIQKASVCKRLINPEDCNPRCQKGFTFTLDGQEYQKCRFMAFMPTLNKENNAFILEFIKKELSYTNKSI